MKQGQYDEDYFYKDDTDVANEKQGKRTQLIAAIVVMVIIIFIAWCTYG